MICAWAKIATGKTNKESRCGNETKEPPAATKQRKHLRPTKQTKKAPATTEQMKEAPAATEQRKHLRRCGNETNKESACGNDETNKESTCGNETKKAPAAMKQIEKTEDPETETVATDNQGTEIMMMTWGGSVDDESSPDPPPSQCRGLSDSLRICRRRQR